MQVSEMCYFFNKSKIYIKNPDLDFYFLACMLRNNIQGKGTLLEVDEDIMPQVADGISSFGWVPMS